MSPFAQPVRMQECVITVSQYFAAPAAQSSFDMHEAPKPFGNFLQKLEASVFWHA
jgi:hypothetical protein